MYLLQLKNKSYTVSRGGRGGYARSLLKDFYFNNVMRQYSTLTDQLIQHT